MTILVVEDDEMLRNALVGLLVRRGYPTQQASSGNQAIRVMESGLAIDLVISDYYMPDGNGRQLLDYVRARAVDRPPFILITGQTDMRPGEIPPGIDELLLKPIEIRDLMKIIGRYAAAR
jgi:CheY-like chemotaxis protein